MFRTVMQSIVGGIRMAAPVAVSMLLAFTLTGCGSSTASADVDSGDNIETNAASYEPQVPPDDSDEPFFDFDETDTDGITADDYTELDNGDLLYEGKDSTGYFDSDGYQYHKNSDGSLEVTDGYGNAVKDYDGDGEADAVTTDGGATWVEVN